MRDHGKHQIGNITPSLGGFPTLKLLNAITTANDNKWIYTKMVGNAFSLFTKEFGAEVWIGKIKDGTNDHAIKVAGYFGVDPNRPRDNYIYASISSFTLDSVFKAFELGTPDMPKFVRETGFPEGITVAYSLEGRM